MEALQRRYTRNFDAEIQNSPSGNLTEAQIRKALIERRYIIGPNGEKFPIPKHMSLKDMVSYFKTEFGLTHAEVTQVFAAAELLMLRPDYIGKLNRVVIDGSENPLRIEIPGKRPVIKKHAEPAEEIVFPKVEAANPVASKAEIVPEISVPKLERPRRAASRPMVEPMPTLEISLRNPSRDINTGTSYRSNIIPFNNQRTQTITPRYDSYVVPNNDAARRNEINVNAIVADRMRTERAEERRQAAQREQQSKELEKQMRAHYEEQVANASRKRRGRAALAFVVALLWATGMVVQLVEATRGTQVLEDVPEPPGIHDTSGKLFGTTPETISYFTDGINLIPTSQRNLNWQCSIENASQGLKPNSNLTTVLGRYSEDADIPVTFGEIDSYQKFEQMLQNGDEAIYTSGPAYFEDFSRQMLHGMLKDKYGAEKVKATYQKTGANNQNYEFYIRYFKSGSSSERTPEGRVTMTRNAEGRLQTNEYHTLPYEVYETLAIIGEFSDFTGSEKGEPFDIQGYADRFTDGDVQRARVEIRERMTYGMSALEKLVGERVRADQVNYYRYER